jgi:hypothetical protein
MFSREDSISSLESRMKQLEAVITASGLDVDGIDAAPSSRDIESQEALSDKLAWLMISKNGTSYVGVCR